MKPLFAYAWQQLAKHVSTEATCRPIKSWRKSAFLKGILGVAVMKRICVSTVETRVSWECSFLKDKHHGEGNARWVVKGKKNKITSDALDVKSVSEKSQRAGNCVRNLMLHGLAQTPFRPQQGRRRNAYTRYTRVQQVPLDTTYQARSNWVCLLSAEGELRCTKSERKCPAWHRVYVLQYIFES
jgi:hypothetical protein